MSSSANFDTNNDQIIDETGYDTDSDNRIDTWYIDTDQNGVADQYAFDVDRNGVAEVWNIDANEDGVTDRTVTSASGTTSTGSDLSQEVTEDLSAWFQQATNFTCGPAAATQILEDFTGRDFVNEAELYQYASAQGWMSERGMSIYQLDDLLTTYGVPSHVEVAGYDAATALSTVDAYIEQGRAVVLFVDSSEYLAGMDADSYHFVRIVDVDMERGVAILSDSASPSGAGLEVSLTTLAEAWNEGAEGQGSLSYHVVLTDVTDADGVARAAEQDPEASRRAIRPGEPLAVLPIALTRAGYERLLA